MYTYALGYVEDIYQVMLSAIQDDKLEKAKDDLKQMTPLPMNTMLEKQSKAEAIGKKSSKTKHDYSRCPTD
jgi:hypothetical protein